MRRTFFIAYTDQVPTMWWTSQNPVSRHHGKTVRATRKQEFYQHLKRVKHSLVAMMILRDALPCA